MLKTLFTALAFFNIFQAGNPNLAPSQPPTITSIVPNQGPIAGSTPVVITGTNFTGTFSVTFGGINALSFTVGDVNHINATTPSQINAGAVTVVVTTPAGNSGSGPPLPVVSSVSTNSGPIAGGTSVTINGTNFSGATNVTFAGATAACGTSSSGSITCTTPPGLIGTAGIVVTTSAGSSAAALLFSYTVATSQLFGLSISGPEFSPALSQSFPSTADWNYFATKGIPYVRLPIAWESLQPTLSGALNSAYLTSIKNALAAAASRNIGVILDLHNFAAYASASAWNITADYAGNGGTIITGVNYFGDGTITPSVFSNVWLQLATNIAGLPGLVGYELMNEPGGWNFGGGPPPLTATALLPYYQTAINTIRAIDPTTPIYLMWPDTYNGSNFPGLISGLTGANLRMDYHTYFDDTPSGWSSGPSLYSGNYASYSQTTTGGVTQITPYVQYLQTNNYLGFVGEFNSPNDSTAGYLGGSNNQWTTLQNNFLVYLKTNNIPVTMWFYGANGIQAGNLLNVSPSATANAGSDDPRLIAMLSTTVPNACSATTVANIPMGSFAINSGGSGNNASYVANTDGSGTTGITSFQYFSTIPLAFTVPQDCVYTFTINAFQTHDSGVANQNSLMVMVDWLPIPAVGQTVANNWVQFAATTTRTGYQFSAPVTAGTHALAVGFNLTQNTALASATQGVHADGIIINETTTPILTEPPGSVDPWQYPGSAYSFWKTAIGTNAVWSAPTDADTVNLNTAPTNVNWGSFTFSYYEGQNTDPVGTWTSHQAAGYPWTNPFTPYSFHIPVAAAPAPGSDTQMMLTDGSNDASTVSNRRYAYESGNGTSVTGGSPNAVTVYYACPYDNYTQIINADECHEQFGIIRMQELLVDKAINHVLELGLEYHQNSVPTTTYSGTGWPDQNADVACYQGACTGPIQWGAFVGIPSVVKGGPNCNSLGLTANGVILCNTLQTYGALHVIQSGNTSPVNTLYGEWNPLVGNPGSNPAYQTAIGQIFNAWQTLTPYLRIMRNNTPTNFFGSGPPYAIGGGTPLAPQQQGLVKNLPAINLAQ